MTRPVGKDRSPNRRKEAVAELERRIGHAFADRELLESALTHASVTGVARAVRDNERLEFLGDRVLGLVIAEALATAFPEADEGELTKRLHALVRQEACAASAREMGLADALRLARGESITGGRDKDTVLGDACEALLAALYRDAGLEVVRGVILRFWGERLRSGEGEALDVKTALQQWSQSHGHGLPRYEVTGRSGPDHAPTFTVALTVGELEPASGQGRSRQEAEKAAAREMMDRETKR